MLEAQVLQKNSPAEAAKSLGAFVEKNPTAREARLNYARVLVLDKRLPEARKQFEAVANANPQNPDVIYAVGLLAFQLKDYRGRRGLHEARARPQLPRPGRRALPARADRRGAEAVAAGDRAGTRRSRTATTSCRRACAPRTPSPSRASSTRRAPTCAAWPTNIRRTRRSSSSPRRRSCATRNRHGDAFKLLSQALDKQPDQPDLLYDLALTAEKLERFDLLETHLRKLIQVKPDHAHAYNALGYSFAERNLRLPEARKLIEKALEISPEDYFIIDSLGWVLYREGDLKGAARELRRAYGGRPDAEIGAHLGEVLWMLGEREEARRIWDESLKAGPDNETLQKTIKRLRK